MPSPAANTIVSVVLSVIPDSVSLAAAMADSVIERGKAPEHKPWGMYEVSLNGPDDLLVRIGWPSRLVAA